VDDAIMPSANDWDMHFASIFDRACFVQEEKVAEAERELNDAQHKVENTKQTYETIVLRMSQDLSRFQKERAVELAAVLREFAITQAQLAADSSKVWQSLVSDMSSGP
jgi:sorting nexin-1/2